MRDALLVYASNGTINCVIDNNAVASGYSEVDKGCSRDLGKGQDDAYVIPTSMTLSADQSTEAANHLLDIQTQWHGVHRQVHHRRQVPGRV